MSLITGIVADLMNLVEPMKERFLSLLSILSRRSSSEADVSRGVFEMTTTSISESDRQSLVANDPYTFT